MIRAMIFDLDGTLLNTLDDLADSVNAAMREFSLPLKNIDEVRDNVGNGGRRLIAGVVPGGETNPRFEEILAYYVPYYQAHCRIKTKPYDGVLPLLAKLREEGILLAIVSNKGDGAVKELSREYFQDLVCEAVGEREGIRRKPAPDSVAEAMRLMQVTPEETLYIGDSEVDYETAANAGVPCALVTWGFRGREALAQIHPDYLIDHPQQLTKLICG